MEMLFTWLASCLSVKLASGLSSTIRQFIFY
jgi:hypothetical protein